MYSGALPNTPTRNPKPPETQNKGFPGFSGLFHGIYPLACDQEDPCAKSQQDPGQADRLCSRTAGGGERGSGLINNRIFQPGISEIQVRTCRTVVFSMRSCNRHDSIFAAVVSGGYVRLPQCIGAGIKAAQVKHAVTVGNHFRHDTLLCLLVCHNIAAVPLVSQLDGCLSVKKCKAGAGKRRTLLAVCFLHTFDCVREYPHRIRFCLPHIILIVLVRVDIRIRIIGIFEINAVAVEKVENGYVYTIEGNSSDKVMENQYSIGSPEILGYGKYKAPERTVSGDAATQAWKYLKSYGYSDSVVAGIIGNMMRECGGDTLDLDWDIIGHFNGDEFYGLCQWCLRYTPSGFKGSSIKEQCEYLHQTIQGEFAAYGGNYHGITYLEFLQADTRTAAEAFCCVYERCGDYANEGPRRANNAERAYNQFHK